MSDDFDNVTPIHSDPAKLKPRAKALLAEMTFAADFAPQLERDYVVKGWFDRSALSVVYGPSNVGKSFFALDLAHHIAKGASWGGRRVRSGPVLYIAAEGGNTFRNRVAALDDPGFWVLTSPVLFTGRDAASGPLAETILHLASQHGPFGMIVIDTMSRVMGAGDENTAPDIADLLRNLDILRRRTGSHIMLIHHTGKDAGKGARGHSSLRAAIDTEVELTRDDLGIITAEVTKQRDGPTGYRFSYTLRQVELGTDQDGDPVTSCLVEPTMPAGAGRAEIPGAAQDAADALDKLLDERGEMVRKPEYPGSPCVSARDWWAACVKEDVTDWGGNEEARRKKFGRARAILERAKLVLVRDDLVWKVEP